MAKNEAKIKFTAETGEFNKSIQNANREMSELRAELKLNEVQMKSSGASVEALEKKHDILQNQLSASESKTEALNQKVKKAVEIFGENSQEASKLKVQLLNAQTAEEKLRQAVAQCADELSEFKGESQDSRTAFEKLSDTIEEQKSKLDRLKQEFSNAVLEHGKLSKEARTLAKEIKSVSSDLDENQKAMSRLEDAADRLDSSLDQVDETADKVSEGFTVMKGAMADLVADGIEGIISGFSEIAKGAFVMTNDIDKATNDFIAKTGASTKDAERFEDVMVNIYNGNYGESFEDIADSMAIVRTSMGNLGSNDLENLTTKALTLRDTFDMDVNESVRAVNSMMDQFGLTGDEAFNLIAQGAQNGLNQNGDLLDVVNEYSVQFKNAGYSADDMFNMLANGVDAGTWSVDKLGDAVKEFNIRASDGTVGEAIKENAKAFGLTKSEAKTLAAEVESGSVGAYQKLADTLRGVDDDTQRYQLGVAMFGTMWEDLGEDAVMAMLDTKGEISTTKDALDEINTVKYDDLGSAFEGIKRNLETSVSEPIKENVMPAVNEFVQDVDWQGVGNTIGEAFGAVVEGAFALVGAVKEAVTWMNEHKAVVAAVAAGVGILATAITAYNVVQGIKTAMEAANVTTVWGLVAAHIAQAAAAMLAIAPYVLIVAAIAAVIAIIVLLIKNWDKVVEACKKAWEAVKKTLAQWGAWINTNVIQPIVKFFSNLWSKTKELASNAWNGIKSTWGAVKDWFNSTIIQPVSNFFSNLWTKITSAASNAWNSVKSKASSAFDSVKSIVSSVKSTISSILDSIKSKFTSVFDGAKNIVKNAIEKIKGFFKFDWSLPKIKMPHFKISGKFSLNPPSIPKITVDWYKDGAIFMKPTLFNTPYGLKGVGEAGAEAVLPIDKLEGYISNAIEKAQNVVDLNTLAAAIEDLANRPVALNINGRQFAMATASDTDSVGGMRSTLRNRGLAVD